jgi:predicted lipoprotein
MTIPTSYLAMLALMFGFAATASAAEAADRQSHEALARNAIDTYVLPKVETFELQAVELAKSVAAYCAAPNDGLRQGVRDRFRGALLAWADVEIVRIGPVTQAGRAQRIAFWPDPRGAIGRQLRPALARRDPTLTSAKSISGQSAALQGFPALEQLLTDPASPLGASGEDGQYRCKVAAAIASNIATIAGEIARGWKEPGGWRERMLHPGPDNPTHPSATVAAGDVLRSLVTSLQIIIEAELKPLAEGGKKLQSFPAPYKRLELSRDYLLAGIKACRALYDAARFESYLDKTGEDDTGAAIGSLFDAVQSSIADDAWMAEGAEAKQNQDQARTAASMLAVARRLIATDVANAAQIPLGFNELDGD